MKEKKFKQYYPRKLVISGPSSDRRTTVLNTIAHEFPRKDVYVQPAVVRALLHAGLFPDYRGETGQASAELHEGIHKLAFVAHVTLLGITRDYVFNKGIKLNVLDRSVIDEVAFAQDLHPDFTVHREKFFERMDKQRYKKEDSVTSALAEYETVFIVPSGRDVDDQRFVRAWKGHPNVLIPSPEERVDLRSCIVRLVHKELRLVKPFDK